MQIGDCEWGARFSPFVASTNLFKRRVKTKKQILRFEQELL